MPSCGGEATAPVFTRQVFSVSPPRHSVCATVEHTYLSDVLSAATRSSRAADARTPAPPGPAAGPAEQGGHGPLPDGALAPDAGGFDELEGVGLHVTRS